MAKEEPTYIFDNSARIEAAQRFKSLEALHDPITIRHLDSLNITEGWRCLEIGAGSGSIARWLADRVGKSGKVVATDLNTSFLESSLKGLTNVAVIRHDIGKEDLENEYFDLVHSRHVLVHVPNRQQALSRMVSSLRRGGWILIEDFSPLLGDYAVGDSQAIETYRRFSSARFEATKIHDMGLQWGRNLVQNFQDHGLIDIGMEAYSTIWREGNPGNQLDKVNFEQLRKEIINLKLMTAEEFEQGLKIFDNPNFGRVAPVLIVAWGRRRN